MKTWFTILAIIGILVLAVVIAIDPLAETIINRRLSQAPAIRGAVGNVDVKLWQAAIHTTDIEIFRRKDTGDTPMLSADVAVVDLRWGPLFRKTLVGDVYLKNAEYNHEMAQSDQSEKQQSYHSSVQTVLLASVSDSSRAQRSSKIPPFTVDSLHIDQGKIHFTDPSTDPPLTASITELQINGKNISNQPQPSQQLPASLQAEGVTTGNGQLALSAQMNLLPDRPEFVSDLEINRINLPELNDFFEAYTGISMNEGRLDIASELKVNNGVIDGYIEPNLQNIKVVEMGKGANAGDGLFNKSWELLAGLGLQLLQNDGQESMGRIDVHQEYTEKEKNQQKSVFESIGEAISEAFDEEIGEQREQNLPKDQD